MLMSGASSRRMSMLYMNLNAPLAVLQLVNLAVEA